MGALPTIIGLALLILLGYSGWRWFHASDREDPTSEMAPPDFAPTEPGNREQPLDTGGGPVPKKPV